MAAGDGRAPSPEPLRLGCTGQENGSKSEIAEAGAWRRKRDGSPQPLLELSAPPDPRPQLRGHERGRFLHREGQISAFPALPGPNFSLPHRPVPPAGARRRPPPSRLPRSASPGAPSAGWPRLRAAAPAPPSPVPPCLTVAVGRLWSRPSPPKGGGSSSRPARLRQRPRPRRCCACSEAEEVAWAAVLLLLVAVVVLSGGFVTMLPAPGDCSAPHGALRVLWCTSVRGGSPRLAFAFPEWRAKSRDGMDPAVQGLVSCWKAWPQAAGELRKHSAHRGAHLTPCWPSPG